MSEVEQQEGGAQKPPDPYLPWGFPEEFDLCDAVRVNDLKKISQCIGDGAKIDFFDGFGRTPLHYACQCNHHAITKLLLISGAEIKIECLSGCRPIDFAPYGSETWQQGLDIKKNMADR
ncbi:ankyrin repeat protein [Opisthorchis viverrini]|uniref:Ankyrin repeat protein n=1 Tax=Opisthorchis viverrini TaxID=6198 RepID=A0A1S8WQJ1_OPIVI|nr:ankyrin repeat protein [Opisthorchis viverrini]